MKMGLFKKCCVIGTNNGAARREFEPLLHTNPSRIRTSGLSSGILIYLALESPYWLPIVL